MLLAAGTVALSCSRVAHLFHVRVHGVREQVQFVEQVHPIFFLAQEIKSKGEENAPFPRERALCRRPQGRPAARGAARLRLVATARCSFCAVILLHRSIMLRQARRPGEPRLGRGASASREGSPGPVSPRARACVRSRAGGPVMSAANNNVPAMPRHQAIVERHFQDPSAAEHDVRASRVNAVVASHVARHRCRPRGVCRQFAERMLARASCS